MAAPANWRLGLWAAILARAKTDTGTAGIFEASGVNEVTGFFNVWLTTDQLFPAVVFEVSLASDIDAFTAKVLDIEIRFHVFTKMVPTDGDTDGGTLLAGIVDRINGDWITQATRIPSYGFDRFSPTIAGWNTDLMAHTDSIENHEQENGILHQIESFDMVISKQGA